MTNNKQNQKAGNHSQVNQAGRDINQHIDNSVSNYHGPSYSDIKDIANDIYEKNALQYTQKAINIVDDRIEKFQNKFAKDMQNLTQDRLESSLSDPEFQAALYEAQKSYAKRGNEDKAEILIKALTSKAETDNDSLQSILLSEAINVTDKLTSQQINALILIYILRNLSTESKEITGLSYYFDLISKFLPNIPTQYYEYEYLASSNALTQPGVMFTPLEEILNRHHPAIFKSFDNDFTNPQNQLKTTVCNLNPQMHELWIIWDNILGKVQLTPVGTLIAHIALILKEPTLEYLPLPFSEAS